MMIVGMLASFGMVLIILALCIVLEFEKISKKEAVLLPRMELRILLFLGTVFVGISIIGGIGVLICRFFFK